MAGLGISEGSRRHFDAFWLCISLRKYERSRTTILLRFSSVAWRLKHLILRDRIDHLLCAPTDSTTTESFLLKV